MLAMLASEKNRLNSATTVAIRSSIEGHIAWLERALDNLDKRLRQALTASPLIPLDFQVSCFLVPRISSR